MYEDDAVMLVEGNPFTMSSLVMCYDMDVQNRIRSIITTCYTRKHLLRSIGNEKQVDQLYKTAKREGSRKKGWERLMQLPPETSDAAIQLTVMTQGEFDMMMHDKYLGGAYDQSSLSSPDDKWAICLNTYEELPRYQQSSRVSES